ncbi:TonB-dependent receptor [Marinobacter salarius]|uniref:TonB-dependent receptor n=1 Tax=Marinobacter salarius TaxID=1420917 RepID=UPI0032EDD281
MKKNDKSEKQQVISVASTFLVALLAQGVLGSAASAQDAVLDEIVVTAQKRSESLQSVPLSISALTGDDLEKIGAKTFVDMANSIPGLSYIDGGGDGIRPVVRGVSSFLGTPTVAVYLDEAPIQIRQMFGGSGGTFDIRLIDIERVEVLRGPQGTLYGGSSMGGAIRYIMAEPNLNEIEGKVRTELSATKNGSESYEAAGAVSIPIVQNRLAARASVAYRQQGGFVDLFDQQSPPQLIEKDIDDFETMTARAALRFAPAENIDITPSIFYQKVEGDGLSLFNSSLGFPNTDTIYDETMRDRMVLASLDASISFGSIELTSITSYSDRTYRRVQDTSRSLIDSGFPAALGPFRNNAIQDYEIFTQEVRLQSLNEDSMFDWLIGIYYSDSKLRGVQPVEAFGLGGQEFFTADNESQEDQVAGFGEIYFRPVDKLTLTAGIRVTDIDSRFLRSSAGVAAGNPPPPPLDISRTDKPVAPKFNISYEINDDSLVYLQAARGFRPGLPSGITPNTCDAELADRGLRPQAGIGPDKLWTYEAGAKVSVADNRARINASAYYTDWTDKPESISLLTCGFRIFANVGKAKIQGVEIEAQFALTNSVTLTANLSHSNAEYATTEASTGFVDGDPLPNVPDWTAAVGGQYEFEVSDMTGFARFDLVYRDKAALGSVQPGFVSTITPYSDSYEYLNLRTGLEKEKWTLSLFVNNAFNSHPVVQRSAWTPVSRTQDRITTIRPRTIGIAAGYNF